MQIKDYSLHTEFETSLDEVDVKLLNLLFENSRELVVKLSAKIGLSTDAIIYRIRRYRKFCDFTTITNVNKLGFHFYDILLDMKTFSHDEEIKFKELLRTNPRILKITKLLGNWAIIISVSAKDAKDFHGLVQSLKVLFSKQIRDFDTLLGYKEIKNKFII